MQKKPLRLFCFFISIFQFFLVCGSRAASPEVHISPTPNWLLTYKPYNQSIPARDVENGYFYELFEEQIQVEKQADYNHIIKEIVSEAGIQNGSEISISFDPSYQRIDFHQITVWRDNKPQNRLSAGGFKVVADEKELSKFIYQGTYSAYFILNDVRKGDKIEYAYTITGRNPIFDNKFFTDIYVQGTNSIAHRFISIQASPLRKLNFKDFNKVPKTIVSESNGLKCYEWESFQDKPVDSYDNAPGWYDIYGHIQISEYSTWNEVVNWAMKINPIATHLKGDLLVRVSALKKAAGADQQKYFRGAVKLVQDEVRYMGIEMGEYSHKANDPAHVFDQRYGDCKDKSLLLASILNADGIEAHMVLINTTTKSKTDQFIPSPYIFDHATVVAIINGKQVFIDPTIAYQRGTGANLYYPDYGEGLILKYGSNSLTTIPLTPTGKITCEEKFTVPDGKGDVKLDVTTTYTLNQADDIRDRLASTSASETEKSYLNYYAKTYPKIESTDTITELDNEDKNQLITIEHYKVPDFFKKESETGRYKTSLYANYISEQLITVPAKVSAPVAVSYPYAMDYTVKVVLPAGWNIDTQDSVISRDAYRFEATTTTTDDTLSLNYQFAYLKNFIPANKVDEYREDVKQITDNELSFTFNYTPDADQIPSRFNYGMCVFAIVLAGILGFIALRIYRTETDGIVFTRGSTFVPIGGWLLLILIGLSLTTVVVPFQMFNNGYFDLNKWNAKLFTTINFNFRCLFVFEVFGNTVLACYSCFCVVLLLNRRDILPKFIIGFYAFALIFFLVDYIFISALGHRADDEKSGEAVIRGMIVAAIWIPYFMRSTRVEETFIVPFPAGNYSYEEFKTPSDQQLN